jgi:hypothetical protein
MPNKQSRKQALMALGDPSRILRKLLMVIDKRRGIKTLPPAGKRSGEGSDSLAPFLEEARNSKPGDLQ